MWSCYSHLVYISYMFVCFFINTSHLHRNVIWKGSTVCVFIGYWKIKCKVEIFNENCVRISCHLSLKKIGKLLNIRKIRILRCKYCECDDTYDRKCTNKIIWCWRIFESMEDNKIDAKCFYALYWRVFHYKSGEFLILNSESKFLWTSGKKLEKNSYHHNWYGSWGLFGKFYIHPIYRHIPIVTNKTIISTLIFCENVS